MYDLHCHLLPGIDDGAPDYETSLAIARAQVDQGVLCVACTPHILPGLYHNTGPQIKEAVAALRLRLEEAGIGLKLVSGADNHIAPDFVPALKRGHLLPIGDTSYVLVEPPHHVAPARLEELFFDILLGGYTPVLTHPERLSWIEQKYDVVQTLAAKGVWMQITSGSVCGRFGSRPDLAKGRDMAARLVGPEEAHHLVVTRPLGILRNTPPKDLPAPSCGEVSDEDDSRNAPRKTEDSGQRRSFMQRLFG